MRVKDIMETDVYTIRKEARFEDVVRILREKNISGLPVVDETNRLVGIVSYSDLLRLIFPYYESYYRAPELYGDFDELERKPEELRRIKVQQFMSDPVYMATPEMPILHAAGMMLARNVQRLPVVLAGELVGLVTRKQILREVFKSNFGAE